MTRRALTAQHGFTIIEVLGAMIVLTIGVLGTLGLLNVANRTTSNTRAREAATSLARELVEGARSISYASLQPTTVESMIQDLPGLGDAGASAGWTINRRGVTFTVTATECLFDDPSDGGGAHGAGSFCADSAPLTSPADKVPEDYKRVRVDVSWTSRGVARNVHQTELINNNGSAGAPAVRSLALTSPVAVNNQILTGTTATFGLTTSSRPATAQWLLDGAAQGPITTGSGLSWSFNWDLGTAGAANSVVDGSYVVSAQAFDTYGQSGPTKSYTITVNRLLPAKVQGVAGGRTGDPGDPSRQAVDVEWLPNPERDITGYSVYRVDAAGNRVMVCPPAQATSCLDASPPNEDNLHYYVRAWDVDEFNTPRDSTVDSTPLVVRLGDAPPFAPLALTAVTAADGSATLTWTRPSPQDPDPGDAIAFYRIYRDGQAYANRYARWSSASASVTFVDGNTGGLPHQYWVTAVDNNYAESSMVGPVSGG